MHDLPPAPSLGYAGLALDRCGERRDDVNFLAAAELDPAGRVVLFVGDKAALASEGDGLRPLLGRAAAAAFGRPEMTVFLGRDETGACFAARLPDESAEALEAADGLALHDLRAVATDGRLAGPDLALAGYAKSMLLWHARHRFCANCGHPSEMRGGGWRRECSSCSAMHFPRTDPVSIMLVTRGERCLLGRQPRFVLGMYSCLAGFVEPGETIEEAARREIFEEAGVRVGRVDYAFSQPWPFPSQLMLGLVAEALTDDVVPDLTELEDVRWFGRDEVASMLARSHPGGLIAPPPAAIAHHLLRRFVTS